MTGITAYGAYVPPTRLPFAVMAGKRTGESGPERAVAWHDEDSVTMAVAAAANCLRGIARASVGGVFFASTTYAFREKQAASLVAKALDLRRDIVTADFAGSLRAGTTALRAAIDAVSAGRAASVLVVASDCRMAAPGSALERNLGDGAAAFLIANDRPLATLEDASTHTDEIVDVWRTEADRFVHAWEERFVVDRGYGDNVRESVAALLRKTGTVAAGFDRLILYGPDERSHAAMARSLGFKREQVQDPFFGRLGSTGAAFAPMLLAAALETARPGDRLLVISYGDGAEALTFCVADRARDADPTRGVFWHLERRRAVADYDAYLKARNLTAREYEAPRDQGLSATVHFRDRDADISLRGQTCRRCGATQFPMQRVCAACHAKDDFESVRLSDRSATVVTFTFDYFFPRPDPPTVVAIVEVEGGCRLHMQLVECSAKDTRIGLPVEFVFRRIHEVGGRPNYYWKCAPAAS
ncbi:MAG: OB-fold domain-containing protein [Candidatus Binatia bacterium]